MAGSLRLAASASQSRAFGRAIAPVPKFAPIRKLVLIAVRPGPSEELRARIRTHVWGEVADEQGRRARIGAALPLKCWTHPSTERSPWHSANSDPRHSAVLHAAQRASPFASRPRPRGRELHPCRHAHCARIDPVPRRGRHCLSELSRANVRRPNISRSCAGRGQRPAAPVHKNPGAFFRVGYMQST